MLLSLSNRIPLSSSPAWTIHIAVLAAGCLLFISGCQDTITSPETKREAATLDLEPDSVTLAQGDTVQMEAIPRGPQGNPVSGYAITWSSENSTVATVGSDGIAVGQSSGSTTITASAERGGSEALSSQSKIAVDGETVGKSEALVKNLKPVEYTTDTVATGEEVYVDRGFTISAIPSRFEGWTYVRTANDDKSLKDKSAVTFTLTDTATVALAYDERATTVPSWLSDWTDTGDALNTTNVDYDIFTRVFGPGEVELGGNQSGGAEGAESMYVLFSNPSDSPPDDEGGDPKIGSLQVSASTSGEDQDSDGYTVTVDGSTSKEIGPNGSATFSGLDKGEHTVELSGIKSNCSVEGKNPWTVSVKAEKTTSGAVGVACSTTAGGLEVSASTSGQDQDGGYTVTVDSSTSKDLGPNGSATFSGLDEGDHTVELSGVATNCSVEGSNPRTVSVTADSTVSTSYSVSCTTTTGSLEISASTSGDDPDSDGYTVTIDGSNNQDIDPNGSVTVSELDPGNHDVELSGIADNCSVDGQNPRSVSVEAGNTASTGYSVNCSSTTTGGALEVNVSTSGDDPDSDGYTITVDDSTSKNVGPNGTATFSGLSEGDHSVELSGLKSNCSVGQNWRSVSVQAGGTSPTYYNVDCTSTTSGGGDGTLEVNISTSGDNPDPDGYTITIDDSISKDIGPGGTASFSGLNEGDHSVELSGLADNCSVDGQNPRSVSVKAGTTTSTSVSISCTSTTGKSVVEQSCSEDGEFLVGSDDFKVAVNKWGASEATECIQRFADGTYCWKWDRGATGSVQPNFPNVLHGARPFGGDDTGAEGFPIQKKDLESLTLSLDASTEVQQNGKWHLAIENWITSKKPDGTRQAEFITHEVMLILTWNPERPIYEKVSDPGAVTDKYGNTIDYWQRAKRSADFGSWAFHIFRISANEVPEKVDYTALYDYLQQRFGKSSTLSPSPSHWINGVQLGNEYYDNTAGKTVVDHFSATVNE